MAKINISSDPNTWVCHQNAWRSWMGLSTIERQRQQIGDAISYPEWFGWHQQDPVPYRWRQ
jgi:hypothetical protein